MAYELVSADNFSRKKKKKGFWPTTGGYVLKSLEMLERPSQALKVGIKETLDEDPEGFLEGARRGWMGEDAVRMQDFMDPEFVKQHPFWAGVGGFIGDVATDPLTYLGPGLVKGAAKGISTVAKATPGAGHIAAGVERLGQTTAAQNIARGLNVPYGAAKQVLGFGRQAMDKYHGFGREIDKMVKDYVKWNKKRAKELGVDKDEIDKAFRNYVELDKPLDEHLATLGDEGQALAEHHTKRYAEMLSAERATGIRTAQVGQQAVIGGGAEGTAPGFREYIRHVATPDARRKGFGEESFADTILNKDGFLKQRKFEGMTTDEANELTQKLYGYDVFHTDPAVMMGVRYSEHAASISNKWFADQVGKFGIGRTLPQIRTEVKEKAGRLLDENAPDSEILDLFRGIPGTKGGKSEWVSVKGMLDKDGKQLFFPKEVAKQITDRQQLMLGKTGKTNEFVKFYDSLQTGWKKWSLGIRPAYHTRNAVGNVLNAYTVAGVKNPAVYAAAGKLQYQIIRGKKLKDTGNYYGTGMSEKELWDVMNANGITGKHQYGVDVQRTVELEMEKLAGHKKTGMEKISTLGAENPVVDFGFSVGSTIEQNARAAVFIDKLRKARNNIPKKNSKYKYYNPETGKLERVSNKGSAIHYASQETKKALFDYSDLSVFEQQVLKRFVPFYTWSRKNIPAQLNSLVTNPQRLETLQIARAQLEHSGGGAPENEDIGPFWRNRVPLFLGKETDRVRKVFSLLNYAPIADIERLGHPKEMITEMISPLLREPFEQLFNYDMFRKEAVSEYKGQTKDFLGVALPARVYKLAQILVPIVEINRLNPGGVFGMQVSDPVTGEQTTSAAFGGLGAQRESGPIDVPGVARVIRFFLGVQEYDVNLEKNAYWRQKNFVKDLRALKSKLKWAMAKGETRRADELLSLIEQIIAGDEHDPLRLGR